MKTTFYFVYKLNGWLATNKKFVFANEAVQYCKELAGEDAQPKQDMNVFEEKELTVCRFKGKNGEFYIRGRLGYVDKNKTRLGIKGELSNAQ